MAQSKSSLPVYGITTSIGEALAGPPEGVLMKFGYPMRALVGCLIFCAALQCAGAQLAAIGRYSNMSSNAEHCNGYAVELWQSGQQFYGLFYDCSGLSGDVPVGTMESVAWEKASGKLSFKAKLTTGSDFTQGDQIPSHDLFTFVGKANMLALTGTLKHEDFAYRKPETSTIALRLPRQKKALPSYPSVEAWKAANAALLQNSGPKW